MGKRDVGRNFFIEPSTGETHTLKWDQYQGIEVLWNHKNYWVNMQDCSEGVQVFTQQYDRSEGNELFSA